MLDEDWRRGGGQFGGSPSPPVGGRLLLVLLPLPAEKPGDKLKELNCQRSVSNRVAAAQPPRNKQRGEGEGRTVASEGGGEAPKRR